MSRVIDDLQEFIGEDFEIDDVESVIASRFEGAFSREGIERVIANMESEGSEVIRIPVSLYDERIPGTHSYGITLVNGDYLCRPIW
tara:strand:- start:401 stop:658 length:258 start_codon:yes stop_codon:yes gene_type:complete